MERVLLVPQIEPPRLWNKQKVWNIGVTTDRPDTILDNLLRAMKHGTGPITVACANPHSQVEAAKAPEFLDALNGFDIVLPDGIGTVLAAKLLGLRGFSRFTGPDFFSAVCKRLNFKGNRHSFYFIGSTERVLAAISEKMRQEYPHIRVAGTYSPPFLSAVDIANEETIGRINAAEPSFVWVGMTAPKQEMWMRYSIDRVNAAVIAGIGAEFDYFSGVKQRPPSWVRNAGLQWLYRLIQEPRRTWRRHFVSMPLYIFNIMREWIKCPSDR